MATPEAKLKQKFKRRIQKQAKLYGVDVYVDFPSSSQYGTQGRPDIYVDFGPLHFRVETKAKKGQKLSPTQQVWHDRHNDKHFNIHLWSICGEEELEVFFDEFKSHLKIMVEKNRNGADFIEKRILL